MPTAIARHFEALRPRFQDASEKLITDTQHSFEAMGALVQAERPPDARCAYFEIAGVPFLVWEMDGAGGRFHVFATNYVISLGAIQLSSKPSGVLIVAGFHIDLASLAADIATHFNAAAKQPAAEKKRKLLMFGFAESFGHHYWNEVNGLVLAMETGIYDGLDGIIVGPFDYFNLAPALQSKGKPVWKLNAIGSLMTPDQLVLYNSQIVTEESRRFILANAAEQEAASDLGDMRRLICFQIRCHRRPWIHEEEKLADIIATLAREWPGTGFVIDGHSTSRGLIGVKQQEIADEHAMVERLKKRLGAAVTLHSTVGIDINAKINLLQHADMFVGPIGSGGVLSSWLLRKPTICYGPRSFYALVAHQENVVPEGGSMSHTVAPEFIVDCGEDGLSFDVDIAALLTLIRAVAAQYFRA